MLSTVQARIFQILSELIPQMVQSSTHYSSPRTAGELAAHCTVDGGSHGHLSIQIACDQARHGTVRSSWICFDVDPRYARASVTSFDDGIHFSNAGKESKEQAERANVYAANWLAGFAALRRVFRPVDFAVSV